MLFLLALYVGVLAKNSLKKTKTKTWLWKPKFENHWLGRMPWKETRLPQLNFSYRRLWNYCPNSVDELTSSCFHWHWRSLLAWGERIIMELLQLPWDTVCAIYIDAVKLSCLKKAFVWYHHSVKNLIQRAHGSLWEQEPRVLILVLS